MILFKFFAKKYIN